MDLLGVPCIYWIDLLGVPCIYWMDLLGVPCIYRLDLLEGFDRFVVSVKLIYGSTMYSMVKLVYPRTPMYQIFLLEYPVSPGRLVLTATSTCSQDIHWHFSSELFWPKLLIFPPRMWSTVLFSLFEDNRKRKSWEKQHKWIQRRPPHFCACTR